MKPDHLANIIKRYNYMDLQNEQFKEGLSKEEEILFEGSLLPTNFKKITVEEFAKEFEGDTLSILYKDGRQRGFVRLSKDYQSTTMVHTTVQNLLFDIEHPDDGLLVFNLEDYRT